MGRAAVHEPDQVHLQTPGRGSAFNHRGTDHSASSVRTWLDSAAVEKLLLQGRMKQSFDQDEMDDWVLTLTSSDLYLTLPT